MGEVYRAFDRQLQRVVAIKAVHPALAAQPAVGRRLAREARSVASLDHPFICKVHELVQGPDGQAFLVMEYLEGETLKSVIKKGLVDLGKAVRVARELAEALSFAHQRALVHRDIKPSNVMITAHGHVKLLDFGIAKGLPRTDESTTTTITEPGHIIGTPAYMSPEQARGDPVDQRSDIYSFGVVLYECLAGGLPFSGSTRTEYLHQAATAPPKPLPKHVPQELRALVEQCLEKLPTRRLQDLEAARAVLDSASLSLLSASSTLTFSQRVRLGSRPWLAVSVLALAVTAFVTFVWLWRNGGGAGRLRVQHPIVTWPSAEEGSRVSADGLAVSFISTQGGGPRLWVRSIAGNEPKPISNAREAIKTPAWSSDGRAIAYLFRADGRAWLDIVSAWGESEGSPRPIDGVWDDVALVRWIGRHIYFSVSAGTNASVLWRHDRANATDQLVTHSDGKRFTASGQMVNIDVSRDERRVVFVAAQPDTGLWTADLDGRNAARVPLDANLLITPRWKGADSRRVVYIANESGQADVWELALDSQVKTALTTSPLQEEAIDISATGDVVVADTVEQVSHLWSVNPGDASGSVQLTNDSRNDLWPSISSSGRVLFHRRQGSFVVHTPIDTEVLAARWTDRHLSPGELVGAGMAGSISRDGRRAFFLRRKDAALELWVRDLYRPDPPRLIWDRVWYPGTHIETWALVGQTVVWAGAGSDTLVFVRRTAAAEPVYELVRARLAADLTPLFETLAVANGEQRFSDVSVSDDGASLAVLSTNRRPYRGGQVLVLDLARPSSPAAAFEAAEGTQLYVRGWTSRGGVVVLKSLRPDLGDATEVWNVTRRGRTPLPAIAGLLGMTARLDAARDRLFATRVSRGRATIEAVSLLDGRSTTVVSNAVDGITFGGYAMTPDGWLLYMRKATNNDVWVFDFADRSRGSASQGGQR